MAFPRPTNLFPSQAVIRLSEFIKALYNKSGFSADDHLFAWYNSIIFSLLTSFVFLISMYITPTPFENKVNKINSLYTTTFSPSEVCSNFWLKYITLFTVSYTHLTLPTIYS